MPCNDRIATQLQETGHAYFVGDLAEAVATVKTIGLDPCKVIVYGRLAVEEAPPAPALPGQEP